MARRLIDISVPLQNDVPPIPGPGPKIEYLDHQQSLPRHSAALSRPEEPRTCRTGRAGRSRP